MDLGSLLATLRRHQSADEQERGSIEAVIAELERDGTAGFRRSHFSPGHVTASGFVRNGDQVLLIHHDRLGRWMQPGGHIEPEDANVEAAARREIHEETGLADLTSLGLLDVDVHLIPPGRGEPSHLHFDLRWGFEAVGTPVAGDGVSAARWFGPEQLPGLGLDPGVGRAVPKLIGR